MPAPALTASCVCGRVEVTAAGTPIASAACYCRDCQKGARQIEALPNAQRVADPDGGTGYALYRRDRVACTRGAELLKGYKLDGRTTPTNRVVATCCHTAMFVNFDRGPHWISVYRARLGEHAPPLQMRICTRFKPDTIVLSDDVPNHPGYPPALVVKLLASRVAMLFSRSSPTMPPAPRT
ncbi:GFA family protein [Bradyrhizobium sp. 2TAF24]|uniref:GFA family protein n=1 Tax=Bradyrhizobium sp. 2TAF24 TaxID=3233011 RepID=UPI003F92C514